VFHSRAGRHLVQVVATGPSRSDRAGLRLRRGHWEVVVLLIVAAALAVLWVLGVVAFHITAFAIHLLLIIVSSW